MSKRPFRNRLNNLSPQEWLKFQKSWFIHNPPPRKKEVLRHPAKYPETLAQEFIEFFTQPGQVVLDQIRAVDAARLVRRLGRIDRRTCGVVVSVLQEMFAP